ncbi:MAG: TRAP transporter substrate-binding protein [Xenococcaceae cyanobacterium MO_188.B29]|nr:TRAP transporter substrate-binding protein [Xenococcaceae cyanobacterium MO_188.B29]
MFSKILRRDLVKYLPVGIASAVLAACGASTNNTTNAQSDDAVNTSPTNQETYTLKMQSTWAAQDIFQEILQDWANKVNEMSGGRLTIDLLPVGSVVGTSELMNAVSEGILDGGHGFTAYWFGLNRAFSLFGTGPSFGMNGEMLLGWIYYGGGQELYDELLQQLNRNVVSFFHGPIPTQPLGWFDKQITSPDDMKGMKYRTLGIALDVFKDMGVSAQFIPGNEVVPSLERGVVDAAEFNNTTSDRLLGFPDVRKVLMVQSYHQPLEILELMFNKDKYNSLPPDLQAILKYATMAESADFNWKFMDRNSQDYLAIKEAGVQVYKTPQSVLQAQLEAWDQVYESESQQNPIFAKIIDSQKAWAKRVGEWSLDLTVENQTAYNHFFNAQA